MGSVKIFRVQRRYMTDSTVQALCYWISLVVYLAKLNLDGQGAPTLFILNEPHQYLSKGFIAFCKRMCVEGRKMKLAPVFIFHDFAQFIEHRGFVDVLLSSSLNWHLFKGTNDAVYTRLKNYLEPTFTPSMALQSTKQYQYIAVWLDLEGAYQPPFLVNAPDLITKRYETMDNSFLTKRHSRMYGRPIYEIEREIQERQKSAL